MGIPIFIINSSAYPLQIHTNWKNKIFFWNEPLFSRQTTLSYWFTL